MPTAVVTGASSGIGRACARALRGRGFEVWAGVRDDGDAASVETEGLVPLRLDVTDDEQVRDAARRVGEETGGRLAVLVNNAGIAVPGPLEGLDLDDLRRQFDVNVFGVHRVTRAFLPSLVPAHGRIVMMGSLSGRVGMPFLGAYAASKHALRGYTDALRRELAPFRVHVALVEPAAVDTAIWSKAAPDESTMAGWPRRYRRQAQALAERIADGAGERLSPAAVARHVVHAATADSPRARYAMPLRSRVLSRVFPMLPERITDSLVQRELDAMID